MPRYCLQFAENEESQTELASALQLHDLTLLMKAVGSPETAEVVSHRIVHWNVSPNLKKTITVFASEYVEREVVAKLRMNARVDITRQLVACIGIREMAAFAGAVFEALFHILMQVIYVRKNLDLCHGLASSRFIWYTCSINILLRGAVKAVDCPMKLYDPQLSVH